MSKGLTNVFVVVIRNEGNKRDKPDERNKRECRRDFLIPIRKMAVSRWQKTRESQGVNCEM